MLGLDLYTIALPVDIVYKCWLSVTPGYHIIKDFGVLFDSSLSFRYHISHKKTNIAYSILGIIKINFIYMDKQLLYNYRVYKSMVRLHEYANSVWCFYMMW